jgi:hypothetical protein
MCAVAVGCGGDQEAESPTPGPPQTAPQGRALREARWISDSRIAAALASMRRDLRSFVAEGRPAQGLVFSNEKGPRYLCGRKLGQGGPPPTKRLAAIRRVALQACSHLQRALEASFTFRAGVSAGRDAAGAARAAQRARPLLAKARALLDAARTS